MVLMAPGLAGSKELSAFADQFILEDLVVKVKNFFGKKLEISEENGFPWGEAGICEVRAND